MKNAAPTWAGCLGCLLTPLLLAATAAGQRAQTAPSGPEPLLEAFPLRPEAPPFAVLRRTIPLEGQNTQGAVAGDLDGDGDEDLVAVAWQGVRLFLNDGRGVFEDASQRLVGTSATLGAGTVALGDLEGDGDLDLFLAGSANRLFLNDGSAWFQEASWQVPAESNTVSSVELGDVDGDGDLDAVLATLGYVGYSGSGKAPNRLYENDGSGVFTDASAGFPSGDYATDLDLADVDGDGDLDALVVNGYTCIDQCASGSTNELLLNDGNGWFTQAPANLPALIGNSRSVSLGDVDGDGDPDALIGDGSQNRLYLNDGSGAFADASLQLPAASFAYPDLELGDLDGDGDLDAVVPGWPQYLENDGTGWFTPSTDPIPFRTSSGVAALVDADGDGDPDLYFGNSGPDQLLLNEGGGAFQDVTGALELGAYSSRSVAVGDVNGDGAPDLLFAEKAGKPNTLLVNDGTGNFTDATANLPTNGWDSSSVAFGDVDSDGDEDILLGNFGGPGQGQQNRLYRNDGSGTFRNATKRLPSADDFTSVVILWDVDGDDDLDALIGNWRQSFETGQNRLFLNDGYGNFTDATAGLPADTDNTTAMVLGDVDGDGDPDVYVGNTGTPNRLYLNDGSGVFTDAPANIPNDTDFTQAIALGDVDGDGDLDALIANNGPDRLLENDRGVFTPAGWTFPTRAELTLDALLEDIDDDGDLDAILVGTSRRNRVLLNDGRGNFRRTSGDLRNLSSYSVAAADVDLDGDRDLVFANNGQNVVLTNTTRQLARRNVPAIGKPLLLDLYGSPGEAWSLELLTPGGPTPVATGTLDASGRATYETLIPSSASLVGRTFTWRAFLGSAVLSERNPLHETTTITDL